MPLDLDQRLNMLQNRLDMIEAIAMGTRRCLIAHIRTLDGHFPGSAADTIKQAERERAAAIAENLAAEADMLDAVICELRDGLGIPAND